MKILKYTLMSLVCILLTGCWDKIEIDRNIFISTIGIDVGKDIKKEDELKKIEPDEPFGERKIERLNVTYAFPDISGYKAEKGELPQDKFLKTEAYSLEDASANVSRKSSRTINVGHAKLLVISNDVFKYPEVIKEIVDYVSRQPVINRLMNVIVVDGRVEDFMKSTAIVTESNLENYLTGLMEGGKKHSAIFPMTLNEFLTLIAENGNAILPNTKYDKTKNEIIITGVAIIKEYEIEGSLTPQETVSIQTLRGKLKGGKKVIYKNGHPIDFEIDDTSKKTKVSMNNGRLYFNIDIELEGRIKEYYIDNQILSKDEINDIEKAFSKSISEEAEEVIRITQKEFEVDLIGLREYIVKFHPKMWSEIKDGWETYYKDAEVDVNVAARIRRIGLRK